MDNLYLKRKRCKQTLGIKSEQKLYSTSF